MPSACTDADTSAAEDEGADLFNKVRVLPLLRSRLRLRLPRLARLRLLLLLWLRLLPLLSARSSRLVPAPVLSLLRLRRGAAAAEALLLLWLAFDGGVLSLLLLLLLRLGTSPEMIREHYNNLQAKA